MPDEEMGPMTCLGHGARETDRAVFRTKQTVSSDTAIFRTKQTVSSDFSNTVGGGVQTLPGRQEFSTVGDKQAEFSYRWVVANN